MSTTADVERYIESAPAAQRPHLRELYEMIMDVMPDAPIVMPNGFPVWLINDTWTAGFATRKKGPMLYVMAQGVLDRHESTLGRLRSGRSCVEYKGSKTLAFDDLRALAPTLYREARESIEGS